MKRSQIRLGVAVVCLGLAASTSGCNALGLGKNKGDQSGQPTFYDEFFSGQDEADAIASSREQDPAAPARMHRRNRLPGGLSSEAREIERGSFNIY